MEVSLSAPGLRRWLFAVLAVVVGAGVAVEGLQARLGLATDHGVVPMLSLSYEWNLPTVYTAALIFTCVLLLTLVGVVTRRQRGRFVGRWALLALGFAYIGLDELLGFHEMADRLVDLNHLFHFDWIVPAAALLLVLGAVYLPFLRALPAPTRRRFLLAGVIYVGGAVCMEVPLGWWTARYGAHNLGYGLIDALEEFLEMLGLNLFLLGLLDHLALQGVTLRFAGAGSVPGSGEGSAGEAGS